MPASARSILEQKGRNVITISPSVTLGEAARVLDDKQDWCSGCRWGGKQDRRNLHRARRRSCPRLRWSRCLRSTRVELHDGERLSLPGGNDGGRVDGNDVEPTFPSRPGGRRRKALRHHLDRGRREVAHPRDRGRGRAYQGLYRRLKPSQARAWRKSARALPKHGFLHAANLADARFCLVIAAFDRFACPVKFGKADIVQPGVKR